MSQSVSVDGRDDSPQQPAEVGGESFEFLVPGVAPHVMVELPDEMDQALLLCARHRVVWGVEVGDEHPTEVLQQVPEEAAFARWLQICAVPPSTNNSIPVTKLESSEARKSAAVAISWGWPIRPIGIKDTN